MNKFVISFIVGVITGCAGLFVIQKMSSSGSTPLDDVKTTHISGEKIEHSNFDYSQTDRITFVTRADGEGSISTEIPKSNIPEARAWMTKNNGVLFDLLLVDQRMYSISYYRRFGSLSFGAGPVFSEKRIEGVKIGGQYWW